MTILEGPPRRARADAPPRPTSTKRCDWHYLIGVINANGTVSPCCGTQEEADDFGSLADRSFHSVWENERFRAVRRMFVTGEPAEGSICSKCPIPEDQTRARDNYIVRFLRQAPRSIRKRAAQIVPHLAGYLEAGQKRWRRPRLLSRMHKRRYENLLLALEELATGVERPRSYPVGLILDPSSACQLRCPMCPVSFAPESRSKRLLDWDLFERVVDEIGPYLFFVDFFNWGEPLLNKQLPRMLEKLKSYGIEVRVSSNLSLKTSDEMIQAIVRHVDWLTASIDGFTKETYETYRRRGDFGLAMSNMVRIAQAKRALKSKLVIDWQFLVFAFNEHEIDDARRFAKEIGASLRPAAPYVRTDIYAHWLSTIDEYVMGRYKPVREQLDREAAAKIPALVAVAPQRAAAG